MLYCWSNKKAKISFASTILLPPSQKHSVKNGHLGNETDAGDMELETHGLLNLCCKRRDELGEIFRGPLERFIRRFEWIEFGVWREGWI